MPKFPGGAAACPTRTSRGGVPEKVTTRFRLATLAILTATGAWAISAEKRRRRRWSYPARHIDGGGQDVLRGGIALLTKVEGDEVVPTFTGRGLGEACTSESANRAKEMGRKSIVVAIVVRRSGVAGF
jgi:hypothetical protein